MSIPGFVHIIIVWFYPCEWYDTGNKSVNFEIHANCYLLSHLTLAVFEEKNSIYTIPYTVYTFIPLTKEGKIHIGETNNTYRHTVDRRLNFITVQASSYMYNMI